jgi:tetratricopeptide (TPR) repeat protein
MERELSGESPTQGLFKISPMLDRLVIPAGLIFTCAVVVGLPADGQTESGWIGKRVVQKSHDFSLTANGEPVERNSQIIDVYRVERTDGSMLWLKAETLGSSGWAKAQDVVPLDKALDFFTHEIQAKPTDPFLYLARALIWHKRNDVDKALRDYDEAIRLEPLNGSSYRGRGLVWHSKQEYDKAITDFDESIRLDPRSALTFIGRGISRSSKKEFNKAIADYSEAIWLDPLAIAAYDRRGLAWHAKKEHQKAIVDYNVAIRLDSQDAFAYYNRANAWVALHQFGKAVADFDQAIQADETCARAFGNRAWLWSTCPDPKYRDGKKAVVSATRACELTQHADALLLDVLAAAFAEAGDYNSAVKWQSQANSMHVEAEDKSKGAMRLKLYQNHKPCRDPDG